jgi:general secretion pathway protein G
VKETALIMNNITNAINMMAQDCGLLPKSLDDLVVAPDYCKPWGPGPYLKKVPKDAWKHDFEYSAEGSEISLKSFGADGKEGGSNYDKDITLEDFEK